MTFRVECECGAKINVKDDLRGQTRRCPKCKQPILLEAHDRTEAPAVPAIDVLQRPLPRRKNTTPLIVGISASAVICLFGIIFYFLSRSAAEREHRVATKSVEATAGFAKPQPGTGIKETVLLQMMNAKLGTDAAIHHLFELVSLEKDATPERGSLYKDTNNELYLMLTGPADDLTLIQLIMPLEEFLGEENSEVTGSGAAAFGRCVQRMALAADPSWAADLYSWMNENMAHGLIMPDGVSTSKRHLLAQFATFQTKDDKMMVSMTIGVPAKSDPE